MSTKIYHAWKVPANRINDALLNMNEQAIQQESEYLKRAYHHVSEEEVQKKIQKWMQSDLYDGSPVDPEPIRLSIAISTILRSNKLLYKNGDIPDHASANMWFYEDHWYIIQYSNYEWEVPEYAEDFAYWNNTDKPDEISEEEWYMRRKVWDAILENERELQCHHTMLRYEYPHQNMVPLCLTIINDEHKAYAAFIQGVIMATEKKRSE
jgi:hypothetical protein